MLAARAGFVECQLLSLVPKWLQLLLHPALVLVPIHGVNLKLHMMRKLAKWKFWSLLGFGLAFIFLAAFLFATGRGSSSLAELSLIAGVGQLVIFTVLLFYLYKGKLRDALKS